MENTFDYTYSGEEVTVDKLLTSNRFFNTDKQSFLSLTHRETTNHRRIFDALTKDQRKKHNGGSDTYNTEANYPIVNGATVYLKAEMVEIGITYESNITVQNTILGEHWPNTIKKITNDPGYIAASEGDQTQSRGIHPKMTVYVWSRAVYLQNNRVGGFIDITKHIERLNIESGLDMGGNFSITMSPAVGELIVDGETTSWQEIGGVGNVSMGNINSKLAQKDYKESVRNYMLYERILQQNDMVFISFEKLKIEDNSTISDVIENKWIDMMGLVDAVDLFTDSNGNEVGTTVRGRDFTKALMDDNSYFNPYSIGHINSLFGGKFGENGRYLQGEFKSIAAYLALSIKDKVEFIAHQIASVGYVPDDVLSSFKDKTEITEIAKDEDGSIRKQTKDAKGIWKLCKVFIDPQIQDLLLADDSISNPDGSIVDLFRKIAQTPFVEFLTDTYKDKFYLIFRRPPFTHKALLELEESEKTKSVEVTINLEGRKKTGQQPLQIDNSTEEKALHRFPKVVNISEVDVISDNLHFDNEAYAWYQVQQRGNFAGNTVTLGHVPSIYFDEYAQVFGNRRLDVVSNYSDYKFFEHKKGNEDRDKYADQASQELAYIVETTMYLPFSRQGTITMNGDRRIKKGNWVYYRPTQEFFYVTQVTNNITKSGNSIDRTTTIQVERGLVRKYIKGTTETINGQKIKVGYFNIIDIPKLRDGIYDTVTRGSASDKFDYKANIAINTNVFEFFLQRRQSNKL